MGEKWHVPTKILSSADTYLQYDNNGDTNFKALSAEEYFKERKTHFIDVIWEFKSTDSSWKIKSIVGVVFEYGRDYKKVVTEIFVHSINEKKYVRNRLWCIYWWCN